MTQAAELLPGSIAAFSSGEYSDYRIGAFSKVLKTINQEVWEMMGAVCSAPPDYDKEADIRFDEYKAVPWLVANGYIEEIEYTELHLGDYGKLTNWREA